MAFGCPRKPRLTEDQSDVELVFVLVVWIAGEVHQAGQSIYFRSLLSCSDYAADIERTGNEVWIGKNYYQKKKPLIEAHCLPKFLNPQKSKSISRQKRLDGQVLGGA